MTSSVLDWKLEELERRRGIPVGTVKISMLLETAKGIMNAYECCMASSRNVNAIFGAVDYCRDMRVKLTSEAVEQMWGRAKMGHRRPRRRHRRHRRPVRGLSGHPGLRTQRDGRASRWAMKAA